MNESKPKKTKTPAKTREKPRSQPVARIDDIDLDKSLTPQEEPPKYNTHITDLQIPPKEHPQAATRPRVTTGGKSVPEDWRERLEYHRYLSDNDAEHAHSSDINEATSDHDSVMEDVDAGFDAEDKTYFVYHVHRKEWAAEEAEDEIEDMTMGDFTDFSIAKSALYKELLRVLPGPRPRRGLPRARR